MIDMMNQIASMVREVAVLDASEVPLREYVVEACKQNACGRYAKTWTCPPAVGDIGTLRDKWQSYTSAIVFTTCHEIEDSFDIEGMEEARVKHEQITDRVLSLFDRREVGVLSAEGCNLCKNCTYPTSPCRYPDLARQSVESNGISVVELAQQTGIHYKNEPNTVTYFSIIFVK